MSYKALYIPGLGDKKKPLLWVQRQLLRSWRTYGIRTELFTVSWTSDRSFDDRLKDLLRRIDELDEAGETVFLIGASAGASTAIAAYAKRSETVVGAVSICGQLRGTAEVLDPALDINPRFRQSLQKMQKSLGDIAAKDRKRVLTLRPRIDAVVPPDEATLKGAVNYQMPVVGHLFGIGFAIVGEGRRIARFIRQMTE